MYTSLEIGLLKLGLHRATYARICDIEVSYVRGVPLWVIDFFFVKSANRKIGYQVAQKASFLGSPSLQGENESFWELLSQPSSTAHSFPFA